MATKTSKQRRAAPAPVEETLPRISLPAVIAAGTVFIASGAVLVLEILSVRLLAPYVGLTLETTTSIIGAVLAGIAAGAALGGWVADRVNPRRLLVGLLIGGGLLVLLTVPIIRALGPSATEGDTATAVGVTFAALVPVAAVLSGVTPTVVHLQLSDLRVSGTVVGRLSGWATAGALIGTFGTGFVLVPLMPVGSAILAIGLLLILVGFALALYLELFARTIAAFTLIAALGLTGLALAQGSPCEAETSYHCIRTEPDPENPAAEMLILDRDYNSDFDPSDPRYLGFNYEEWMAKVITTIPPARAPLDAVFIGGGAFTLPRWLQATRSGSRSDVLEVDGGLVAFDRRNLDLRTNGNLRATVGDARVTMRREPSHSANFVVGDAFSGLTVPWQLMTSEWLAEVHRVLRPGGIYMVNMIDLRPLKLLRAEAATLLGSFRHVNMVTAPQADGRPAGGNEVLFASQAPLPAQQGSFPAEGRLYNQTELTGIVAGAKPLSDDYAPVDQLETR